jgi:hypothetical protein
MVHSERRGGGLRDDDLIFGRLAHDGPRGPISQRALAETVLRYATIAGVPQPLAHPHALPGYYATTLAGERVRRASSTPRSRRPLATSPSSVTKPTTSATCWTATRKGSGATERHRNISPSERMRYRYTICVTV